MQRWITWVGLLAVVSFGCNDTRLSGAPTPEPTPSASPTPVPCKFYGVDKESNLWLIDPDGPSAQLVGATGIQSLTDLAIDENADMLAITRTDVYRIAPDTGVATSVREAAFDNQVAADAVTPGELVLGGGDELSIMTLASGNRNVVATLPNGYQFAGDIAVRDDGIAFVTAQQSSSEDSHLMEMDPVSGQVTDHGSLGAPRVFGLDFACDGRLFGLIEGSLEVIEVDASTGATSPAGFVTGPTSLWGAAGPADGS